MPNSNEIQAQQKMLMACRCVLAAYLEQSHLWDAHDLPEPIRNGMRYLQEYLFSFVSEHQRGLDERWTRNPCLGVPRS